MAIAYQSLKKDRLVSIAWCLGEQKTREELIPHLLDNIGWEEGFNKLLAPFECENNNSDEDDDDDDEVSLIIAKELRDFIPCIGGVEYAPILLPLLEHLCTIYGDPLVRDTAVDSLCLIACKMSDIHLYNYFVPLLMRLTTCESYTGRVSSCRLFHVAYTNLPESQKIELSLRYCNLCQDDTPIVRRSAATHLGKFISTFEPFVFKISISPLFEHLITDDHDTVRLLAVEACSAFGKLLEHQDCLEQVLPIIDKFSKDKLPRVRYRVAHQLYELCKVVEREETRVDLVRKFARLLQDNEEEVRAEAAGVVVKLCMILSWGIVSEYIYPPVKELLHDSSQKVRWALSGIIGLALNLEKGGHLNELVTTPCRDEADMHIPGINAHIPETSARVGSNIGNVASADSYCHHHEIAVIGNNVPPPFTSFQSTGFPPEILQEVQKVGFSAPSPIQAQSWPIALQNHDIVAVAKTGSGKTLGYLLPGFVHIKRSGKNPKMGPTMLVLSPTCVSARKIRDEAEKFGQSSNISCMCLCGGVPEGPQLTGLDKGVDVVVATPGQLNRILEMGRISLSQVSYLVFDEADSMLNMEFEPGIHTIIKEIPARCQTLVYSATWSQRVRNIASELLKDPYLVNIGDTDGLVANKFIFQHVIVVYSMEKTQKLANILFSLMPPSKTIIFCSTKKMCDQLVDFIPWQFSPAAIHEDQSQEQRDIVLNLFHCSSCHILVATDGAARGLDVEDIKVVINYDFPARIEDYVHRICRTGRRGVAYTLFCDEDAKHAKDLVKILEGANQEVPPRLHYLAAGGGSVGNRNRSRSPPRR